MNLFMEISGIESIQSAEDAFMSMTEFACGLQKHMGDRWRGKDFQPDHILSVTFMVDMDNDGFVSWDDFYAFAVQADLLMRRNSISDRKLWRIFFKQRRDAALTAFYEINSENEIIVTQYKQLLELAGLLAGRQQQPLAIIEFAIMQAGGAEYMNSQAKAALLQSLTTLARDTIQEGEINVLSSPSSVLSSSIVSEETDSSVLTDSDSLQHLENTPVFKRFTKMDTMELSPVTVASLSDSRSSTSSTASDLSIFRAPKKHFVPKNTFCPRSQKWVSSRPAAPRRGEERFQSVEDVKLARKIHPVFFGGC